MQKGDRLQSGLHFLGASKPSNHTIFVDDEEEAQNFDAEEWFDTPKELLGRVYNRPRRAQGNGALLADDKQVQQLQRCEITLQAVMVMTSKECASCIHGPALSCFCWSLGKGCHIFSVQ